MFYLVAYNYIDGKYNYNFKVIVIIKTNNGTKF